MLQVLVIAALVAMHISSSGGGGALAGGLGWWAVAGGLGPVLAAWGVLHGLCAWGGRVMDQEGRAGAGVRAAQWAGRCRVFVCVWLGGTALVLGWTRVVSAGLGIGAAGTVAGAGVIAGALWLTWWSQGAVERRMREALLLRHLDEGRPIWEVGSAGAQATARLRDGVLMVVVPVVVMVVVSGVLGWVGEAVERAARGGATWAVWLPGWAVREGGVGIGEALQVAGFVAAFGLMPVLQRRIWETVELEGGELRARIEGLCARAGVRVRRVLVWRTRGMSVNAAVLGAVPGLRYLIFTDALLEWLPGDEVGAVAAHEIGHVKHHHIAWLVAGLGALASLCAEGGAWAAHAAGVGGAWLDVGALAGVVLVALPVMGVVSRRFEWQADGFAAGLVSEGGIVTGEGAGVVVRALERVSRLSGGDPRAFSWRHGSIAERQRRVAGLVGQRAGRTRADVGARRMKGMIVCAWVCVGMLVAAGEGWV